MRFTGKFDLMGIDVAFEFSVVFSFLLGEVPEHPISSI